MLEVVALGGGGLPDDEIVAEVDQRDSVGGLVGHVVFAALPLAEDGAGEQPGCGREGLGGLLIDDPLVGGGLQGFAIDLVDEEDLDGWAGGGVGEELIVFASVCEGVAWLEAEGDQCEVDVAGLGGEGDDGFVVSAVWASGGGDEFEPVGFDGDHGGGEVDRACFKVEGDRGAVVAGFLWRGGRGGCG